MSIHAILPVFQEWMTRRHGSLSFRTTQILTGHGCFGKYLCRIGKQPNAACHHCDCEEDTAQHTLESCPAWTAESDALRAMVGSDLSLPIVVGAMCEREDVWMAVLSFCDAVMSQKESAERDRERRNPVRRRARRRGRRVT
ncbi:uncharacterized protein LOC123703050 [Colias croceus]|uniref:uncharacterized protein LOC123703050 n=1 Tax=Colias crocea TaxID=72248 RepID=UPI001E27B549|nr:uncharacterized protein LOC123703050 [Colias croceus]